VRYNPVVLLRRHALLALALTACVVLAACGSGANAQPNTPTTDASAVPVPARASAARLLDWPEFGLDAQRSGFSADSTGITAANVRRLRRIVVQVGGTVDSSPIYLHGVRAGGAVRNLAIVTTTYGRTVAIDASSGHVVWRFTPAGYAGWAGSFRITNTSPIADPGRGFVYAASPNGLIHKLSVADGAEAAGWPVSVTRDSTHEKLGSALNIDGNDVLAATSGYLGDAPPYQGHLVAISRAGGHIDAVFNTLCANRRALQRPSTCSSSDSAILSRGGPVVEPGGGRILIDTGNGPWNGSTDFGDSALELSFPGLALRQSFTPTEQSRLSQTDTDLGSSAPALLGAGRAIVAGKDGVLRVLALSRLDGHPPGSAAARRHPLGGEVQRLGIPGGAELFTAPAVWHHGTTTTTFIADGSGTAAYVLRGGRLARAWQNGTAGTSPILAGWLLYVFEPGGGGVVVYRPGSPRPIATLPAGAGHWNSPIVVDGHVIVPEGDANNHATDGTVEILSAP
jgi:hypothetical protein